MKTRIMRILLSISAALCLFGLVNLLSGCEPQNEARRVRPRRLAEQEADTTIAAVIQYADESKRDSVDRWLWNMVTNRRLYYEHQLNAAQLWLILNGHINCATLSAEDRSPP